jgi:hypothetical protein
MAQKLSNLPLGAKIKFGKHQVGSETAQSIIWIVADKNHSGYPSNSVTLITEKIIDLRAYDALESDEDETGLKGGSDYARSNIHQWLNSDASAGKWYTSSHLYDLAPSNGKTRYNTGYDTRAGFLSNFSANEKNALLTTTVVLENEDELTAKVFIPSLWETIGTHSTTDGSSRLGYFKTGVVTCSLTSQAYTNTTSTDKPTSTSVNWKYMTRNTGSGRIYTVTSTGGSERVYPYDGNVGLRPIINLSVDMKISDTVDSDGCYEVRYNTAPYISDSNRDLGTKSNGFNVTYNVKDNDGDSVTVKEYIDNVEVRSYVPTLGATNTFNVQGNTWLKLANGSHTLKIVVTDGFATDTRTITFTKSVKKLVVQRSTPILANKQPTQIIVDVVKTIPYNALMEVYVCNNGFDASPTWEKLDTSSISSGFAHEFKNKTNTAGKWGVNIKVTVDRNGAEGACYITEIGGNFE